MAGLLTQDAWLFFWIVVCAVLIVLPIQLALCFRAKKLFIKCLPPIFFAVGAITCYCLAITARTWAAFLYLIIAAFAAVFLVSCGVAWGIWGICRLAKG